jgi:hypothetical protein
MKHDQILDHRVLTILLSKWHFYDTLISLFPSTDAKLMAGGTGQKEKIIILLDIPSPNNDLKGYCIRISRSGHLQVSKKAWVVRIFILSVIGFFAIYRDYHGIRHYDSFIIYSIIMPAIQ